MSNFDFHPYLVLQSNMDIYPENTRMSEKCLKRKRHTPLNPPSMGELNEYFPSLERCRFTAGWEPFGF
jgi:hypothetical protein